MHAINEYSVRLVFSHSFNVRLTLLTLFVFFMLENIRFSFKLLLFSKLNINEHGNNYYQTLLIIKMFIQMFEIFNKCASVAVMPTVPILGGGKSS